MAEQYDVKPESGKAARRFFRSQLFVTPPYPTRSFAGETVIVTGANSGLGFEAARHFYRLGCAKLIIAVRTISKGNSAKQNIVQSVPQRTDGGKVIQVWPLDLTDTKSTLAFASRVKSELGRLDHFVANAGITVGDKFTLVEGVESTIQVNVLSTLLLALSILPKLRDTKEQFPASDPHLAIVSSEVHRFTAFPERNESDLYAALNDKKTAKMGDRYQVSKLLEILFIREFMSRTAAARSNLPHVTITLVNPGLCKTNLQGDAAGAMKVMMAITQFLIARSTEKGSRTLVAGVTAGPESNGEFMSDGKNQEVEPWIYTEAGNKIQTKVFDQTMKILEKREPGIGASVGL